MFAALVYALAALFGLYGVYKGTRSADESAAYFGLAIAVVGAASAALKLGLGVQFGAAPALFASLIVVNPDN